MQKTKLYRLEIISDARPIGFIKYVIKTPVPENDIRGQSKADPKTFERTMDKTLSRLNNDIKSGWAGNRIRAQHNGRKAINASLTTRRLAKVTTQNPLP